MDCNVQQPLDTACEDLATCRRFFDTYEYRRGVEIALRARDQARRNGNDQLQLAALSSLLEAYRATADHEGALQSATDLLTVARRLGDDATEFVAIHNLGLTYLAMNKVEDGIRTLAQKLDSKALDTIRYCTLCQSLADAYLLCGEPAKADFMCTRAEIRACRDLEGEWNPFVLEAFRFDVEITIRRARIAVEHDHIVDAVRKLLGLIRHAEACCDASLGWNEPEQARQIQSYWRKVEHVVRYYLGRSLLRTREYKAAQEELNAAAERSDACFDSTTSLLIEEQLGVLAMKCREFGQALVYFDKALARLEGELPRLRVEEFRVALRDARQGLFEHALLATMLLRPPDLARAWGYSERSRARVFLDRVASSKVIKRSPRIGLLGEEYVHLTNELADTAEQIRQLPPGIIRELSLRTEERLKESKAELVKKMRRESPLDAALVETPVASLEQVSSILDNRTGVVEFFLTTDFVVSLFVTSRRVFGHTAAIKREVVRNKVRRLRELIQPDRSGKQEDRTRPAELSRLSTELYNRLLRPFANEIRKISRLCIIPHSVLHDLPFGCLNGDRPLVEEVQLIQVQSASILLALLGRRAQGRPRNVVVFANPEPITAPLRYSEKEAKRIRRIIPEARVYQRSKAKATTFRRVATEADTIHLACHAAFEREAPLLSHLRLAGDRDAKDTGVLDVSEIYALRLEAGLVVLSACDSGLSEISNAEELLGLVQAFMVAGASSVIASLWPVSDMASAEFMGSLYKYLSKGFDKAEALRKAQQDLLRIPAYASPFFWSSFQLYGDWRVTK